MANQSLRNAVTGHKSKRWQANAKPEGIKLPNERMNKMH